MRQILWQTMKNIWNKDSADTWRRRWGGKVTVMITLKSTGQKVVEKDQQSNTHQTTKEADSQERQEKVKRNLWIKRPCTVRGQTERRSHM